MHPQAALAILISLSGALCGAGMPATSEPTAQEFSLTKRVDNARFSWYDANVGTCGENITVTNFVALCAVLIKTLTWQQYLASLCGQSITITVNGKSTITKIMDEATQCPGCPPNGLSFTTGLFSFFAPLSDGVVYGSWFFSN
ncbi:hypothetical protein BD779DRAFT_1453174 [Infundibulicybe gibba]|nr:hypothetical protein BD779DRAFT_1453174 [Infundibulicybe gibba]